MPTLRRESDGAGDSGAMCEISRINPETNELERTHGIPQVGWAVRVGSITARTYSSQDWWQTTPITEILEERETDGEHYIRFKTSNSIYEWID